MSVARRPTVYLVGSLVVALVGLIGVSTAESRSQTRDESRVECSKKVSELEAEVRALREQLRLTAGQSCNSLTQTRSGSTATAGNHGTKAQAAACDPPYDYDGQGIKYYKPVCFDAVPARPSCNPPYAYDASGTKSYKPECL